MPPLPSTANKGILISFEGSEGAGKSTQIARLAQHIQNIGREVISTREPGGTEIGEQIRNIIVHNSKGDEMRAETELLLFAAARAQLVRETIVPALLDGTVVLSDRFLDSTTVYQGIARNLALGPVNQINRFAVGNVMPDLTVVIDVPTDVSLARIRQRASDLPDRMERENIDFYEKVREGYLVLAKGMPERIVVIDGTQREEEIEAQIWKEVSRRFFAANSPKAAKSPAPKAKAKPAKAPSAKPAARTSSAKGAKATAAKRRS
ncbi:dTMP kinase [Nibricoccus sp. IMCC34717]|uniref:dTMP kinase n=1 Tax=Nibricoccus sp. IMCC34717 TaxID=3034021 RepID=UPI00384D9158